MLENFSRIQQVSEICNELLSQKSVNSLIKHFDSRRPAPQKPVNEVTAREKPYSTQPPIFRIPRDPCEFCHDLHRTHPGRDCAQNP